MRSKLYDWECSSIGESICLINKRLLVQVQFLLQYTDMQFLNSSKNSKKKLKKKWRFWRSFKNFFLRYKKKKLFCKLNWLRSQKQSVKKQYLYFYGKKIQRLIKKKKLLRSFGRRFFYTLAFLELRLNIILLRLLFTQNIIEANFYIWNGFFLVNKKNKNKNYLVSVGDLIHKKNTIYLDVKKNSYKWRKYLWSKWSWKARKKKFRYLDPFWLSKNNLNLNYTETNHKNSSSILLRKPVLGEIILNNKNRLLTINIIKKIFFVY